MKSSNKDPSMIVIGSILLYCMTIVYILKKSTIYTCGLALGCVLILFSITEDLASSLILGSLIGILAAKLSKKHEGFQNEDEGEGEGAEEEEKPKKKAAKKKVAPPPDNDTRKEFLGLGKQYKAPSEEDDKDFHLDAGTTFMNAYKSLKPDQIAAMTKDTQDLMQTQKQLMSTLHTLKPLIKDGKEMMNMFQSYFGAGDPTTS